MHAILRPLPIPQLVMGLERAPGWCSPQQGNPPYVLTPEGHEY